MRAAIFVDDYNKDSEPEALVRTRTPYMAPGEGTVFIRQMFLLRLEKPAEPLLDVVIERALANGYAGDRGTVSFKDLNGDNYPDVLIGSKSIEPTGGPEKWERYLWMPKAGRYIKSAVKQRH